MATHTRNAKQKLHHIGWSGLHEWTPHDGGIKKGRKGNNVGSKRIKEYRGVEEKATLCMFKGDLAPSCPPTALSDQALQEQTLQSWPLSNVAWCSWIYRQLLS